MKAFLNYLVGIGRATQVDDTGDLQLVQVTEGARGDGGPTLLQEKVPRLLEFGFASVAPLDSVLMMLRRGGERSRSVIIGSAHKSRLKGLKPGDTAIYDVRGAKVALTEDGLVIDCAGLPAIVQNATTVTLKATDKVIVDAPAAEFTGTVSAAGEITARTGGNAAPLGVLHDAYNAHRHTAVKAGTDTSGTTDHMA